MLGERGRTPTRGRYCSASVSNCGPKYFPPPPPDGSRFHTRRRMSEKVLRALGVRRLSGRLLVRAVCFCLLSGSPGFSCLVSALCLSASFLGSLLLLTSSLRWAKDGKPIRDEAGPGGAESAGGSGSERGASGGKSRHPLALLGGVRPCKRRRRWGHWLERLGRRDRRWAGSGCGHRAHHPTYASRRGKTSYA